MSIKCLFCLICFSLTPLTVNAKQILVYGDSLSAAFGMELNQGWVHLLSEKLGKEYQVFNASISGESSAGGLARLPATLDQFKPDLMLLELGANDGLRGYPTKLLQQNLTSMIELATQAGASVVVFGITLPASYGPRYIDDFEATFIRAAQKTGQYYYDFVIDRFIGNDKYIQADGLHPTNAAQPEIANMVYRFLSNMDLL